MRPIKIQLKLWMFLLLPVVAATIILATGTWGGSARFSPYTLQYTGQSEYTICFGAVPIYRSEHRDLDNEVLQMLRDEGFGVTAPPEKQRWELVFHWNGAWKGGYGRLYRTLITYRRENIEWSKSDPERARVFWGEVLKHLRSRDMRARNVAYDLLDFRRQLQTASDFRARIAAMKSYDPELFGDAGP